MSDPDSNATVASPESPISAEAADRTLLIPLPGGGVARVPAAVLEQYRVDSAQLGHPPESSRDVTAHNQSIDTQGSPVWHTEFELGICDYVDANGFPRHEYAWHNHPFGTEYTELFSG
jgi:hypothetical protein